MGKKKKPREINGQKKRKFEIHDDVAPEIYDADDTPPLGSFRIGQDEKPGVLFTRKHQAVNVHYCSESELKCYVLCNSDDDSDCCLLCQIGKKINKRLLYPVVSLETGNVEVLPVSDSLRPYALLPQVLNILSANKRVATFFSQENYKYSLKNFKLSKTERNMISSVIKSFQKSWKVREIDLASVYQHISNSILANYSEIKKKADLKRIKIDSDDE